MGVYHVEFNGASRKDYTVINFSLFFLLQYDSLSMLSR